MRARLLLAAVVPLALAACAEDLSDLHEYVEEVKDRPGAGIPPVPEFEPYEGFIYSSRNLRDPFEPRHEVTQVAEVDEEDEDAIRPDRDRPREALERYPLDSLQMVGTITINDRRHGLVRTPEGTVHRVLVGNYMGENHGEIQAISERSIQVLEIIPDGDDGWMERDAALGLDAG